MRVQVDTTAAGAPLRVTSTGLQWSVNAERQRWYERTRWWESPRTRPHIDIEVWRAQIALGRSGQLLTVNLIRDEDRNGCYAHTLKQPSRAASLPLRSKSQILRAFPCRSLAPPRPSAAASGVEEQIRRSGAPAANGASPSEPPASAYPATTKWTQVEQSNLATTSGRS
jgi:hypothetical protein